MKITSTSDPFSPSIANPLPASMGGTGLSVTSGSVPAALGDLTLQATTGLSGFALQNGTPTILSWTAPNDGNLHKVQFTAVVHVTSAETGGLLNYNWSAPDGTAQTQVLLAAGQGAGVNSFDTSRIVEPGAAVTITQGSALTAGAATVWTEIWGS